MASENETVAEIVAMLRSFAKGEELPTDEMPSFTSLADRLEAAHKHEVAELRECLVRRSSHLNAILQKALELRNSVPPELRKVMDECIVAEDKAIGLGVFSRKGAEDEG